MDYNPRLLSFFGSFLVLFCAVKCNSDEGLGYHQTIYDFKVKNVDGELESMDKYKGKVVIFVNVASYCGYTDSNYNDLKSLLEKYYDQGLRVAAFPCNQFGHQEPDDISKIVKFVKDTYEFTPDLYGKIEVNGENTDSLYHYLKTERHTMLAEEIPWNFSKFLVNKKGHVVRRYSHTINPHSFESEIVELLEED